MKTRMSAGIGGSSPRPKRRAAITLEIEETQQEQQQQNGSATVANRDGSPFLNTGIQNGNANGLEEIPQNSIFQMFEAAMDRMQQSPSERPISGYSSEGQNELRAEEPQPETSTFSLDITARGRPLIIYKGYEHRQVRVDRARNLKAYRCIKKKCKGRLHTDYNDTNVRIVSDHVHAPNFDAEFKRRRRTLLRELAQKGNVSPSQIIQKARDLEMQYHDACESGKTSYAAERRYIQRYWNRQKQQDFISEASLLSIKQKLMCQGNQIKMEQNRDEEDESVNDASSVFPFSNIPSQAAEQFNQFLQMTANGIAGGTSESAMNVYLNVLLQHMLSNAAGSSSSSSFQDDENSLQPSSTYHQEQSIEALTKQTVTGDGCGGVADAAIQTSSDETGSRGAASDAAVRDTLALELGTILAKNFWPRHYLREDKLKLMVDVIGKLLDCC